MFMTVLLLGAVLLLVIEKYLQSDQQQRALRRSAWIANAIERQLVEDMFATVALAALVKEGKGDIANFDTLATQFILMNPTIAALELAPEGIIRKVAPLEGNEQALGLNLLSNALAEPEAQLALQSGKLTLAGPMKLVQGGVGVSGRMPVYLDGDGGKFWGFAITLVSLPKLLESVDVASLERIGYSYTLTHSRSGSAAAQVFWRSPASLDGAPVVAPINVPNGQWYLNVTPKDGWGSRMRLAIECLALLLLAAALAWISRLYVLGVQALASREQELAALLSSMQDRIFVLSEDGEVLQSYEPSDLVAAPFRRFRSAVGMGYRDLLAPPDAARIARIFADIQRDGQARSFEFGLTANGVNYFFHSIISRMSGDGFSKGKFVAVVRDVSLQHRAHGEIARLAQTNALLLESVGEGIYGVDMSNQVTFMNASAQDLLGYSKEQLLGLYPHALFHHHHADGAPYPVEDCPIHNTLQDGKLRREMDEWYWRKDGSGFPVTMTIAPMVIDGRQIGAVVIFQDISERKAAEQRILALALHDELTGLPNRRALIERITLACRAGVRSGAYGAVIFIDLDKFKTLNDTRGHEYGDLLLIEAASRMRACVRAEDTVARLGGDEFVVMLQNLGEARIQAHERALDIARKVGARLAEQYQLKECSYEASASIGVVLFQGTELDVAEIFRRADEAMYRVKASSRNDVCFYED